MQINGQPYRTIWEDPAQPGGVFIIDQRQLPHEFKTERLEKLEDFEAAISEMHVRGAPLIGAAAAYGLYVALLQVPVGHSWPDWAATAGERLKKTRPTAVNLAYAIDRALSALSESASLEQAQEVAHRIAVAVTEESVSHCKAIGGFGLPLIEALSAEKKGAPVQILTHCNAGWMACIDYGTATAPIYAAHDAGIPVHVWVDETRPRNQGARITAFELAEHGVPHTVITDNAGGHLMQHRRVDMVIVGSDRTSRTGDVANKIGTYLKALAAHDNGVPFYVALPSSTFDFTITDGIGQIPIEERSGDEVRYIQGLHQGEVKSVLLTPPQSPAVNFAFDVTPARLVTALITERGICEASEEGVLQLFPEYR